MLQTFEEWLHEKQKSQKLADFLESEEFSSLIQNRNNNNMKVTVERFHVLFALINEFDDLIQQNTFGPMANFWESFIQMVQVLLDYIKSIPIGDWNLHLQSMERMIVWFHAYDRVNYSRHFTYCWATQKKLHDTHPEIYQEFKQGNFSTKRTMGNFNMLPPDQVIEQTINKEQKGSGGIIGTSTSVGSVQHWVLSSHTIATLSSDFKSSINMETPSSKPKDLGEKRKIFDENMVNLCYETINQWNNPFKVSDHIVSLSSGVAASKEIEKDLQRTEMVGNHV